MLTNSVAEEKATTGEHRVVGDGMVRKVEYVKRGDLYGRGDSCRSQSLHSSVEAL